LSVKFIFDLDVVSVLRCEILFYLLDASV
jgi:hypothetical protein